MSDAPPRVLIVDDEPDMRFVLRSLFEDEGFSVDDRPDAESALTALEGGCPDVVLSDVRMPGMTGVDLLRRLQQDDPELPVVLVSAVEDVATAVEAVRAGAYDYVAKPFDQERLVRTVRSAAEQTRLKRELGDLRRRVDPQRSFGSSSAAQKLERTIDLIAPQETMAVLLIGESGTGKEVVARAIHDLSPRRGGPFVAVDCGALPEQLMESQLFGHRKGAFTGADRDRPGLFRMADRGSLFLDEMGNLTPGLQAKLLRALQERVVVPVGGGDPVPFDARLICATNADLSEAVENGTFRVDLYHRIAEFTIPLPSLRERPSDVAFFAQYFLEEANREMGRDLRGFTEQALSALRAQQWLGNVRELRNAVRRAVLLASSSEIGTEDLELGTPPPSRTEPRGERAASCSPVADDPSLPLGERVRLAADAVEARLLQEALAASDGNKAATARALQIDYTTLHRKLKRHGLG